jgi:hypothetical protein
MQQRGGKSGMDVFYHLLYEHGRGLRDLALYTIAPEDRAWVEEKLHQEAIAYLMHPLEDGRINVYFGHPACVDVVRTFHGCRHCELTPQEDFMLGIMLGYDRTRQCERYLQRHAHCEAMGQPCRMSATTFPQAQATAF